MLKKVVNTLIVAAVLLHVCALFFGQSFMPGPLP